MKIGILGLKPRQSADIMKKKLPHDLSFRDNDTGYSHAKLAAFSRDKDHVLIIQKAVPHQMTEAIPKDKRHVITGGISMVLQFIESLPTDQIKVAPKTVEVEEEVVVQSAPTPTVPLAFDIPEGYRSQYLLPKTDILINYPNSGGIQDYQILRATFVGDVVRFARPEGLPLDNWRARITTTRHNYWKRHGILLEAHFFEEYVDLKVMDQDAELLNTVAVRSEESERPADLFESRDMGQTVEVEDLTTPASNPAVIELVSVSRGAEHIDYVLDSQSNVSLDPKIDWDGQWGKLDVLSTLRRLGPVPSSSRLEDILRQPTREEQSIEAALSAAAAVEPAAIMYGTPSPEFQFDDLNPAPQQDPTPEWTEVAKADCTIVGSNAGSKTESSAAERTFWRKVFLQAFAHVPDINQAIADSDTALAAYRSRF